MMLPLLAAPHPPFQVDLAPYRVRQAEVSLNQKVGRASRFALLLVSSLFVSISQGCWLTLKTSPLSFRYHVLGIYGDQSWRLPASATDFVFYFVCWVFRQGVSVAAISVRVFIQRVFPVRFSRDMISADSEINPAHLRTSERALNPGTVPPEIQVGSLTAIFDEINFDHPNQPGYMAPSSLRDDGKSCTREEMRAALVTFIGNVRSRKAFLGTPPSYDLPLLMRFYEQIEVAVRLSLHKVCSELEVFRIGHPEGAELSVEDRRRLNDLLENRARLVLECAIAGRHCGARYMGNVMSLHALLCGGDQAGGERNLQDSLIEILARKRREIAEAEALRGSADTHYYSRYMATIGSALGIPGTVGIVEHLFSESSFSKSAAFRSFFARYTQDAIIEAVQAAVKDRKGQAFRERITDWLGALVQGTDWLRNEAFSREAERLELQIQECLRQGAATQAEARFAEFHRLIRTLRERGTAFTHRGPVSEDALDVMRDEWSDFVNKLFALPEVRQRIPGLKERREIKNALSEEVLTPEGIRRLREAIRDDRFEEAPFLPALRATAIIEAVRAVVPLEAEVIRRLIADQSNLREIVLGHLDRQRSERFLEALSLERMTEEGLSREVLELLLVSHGILHPQEVL